jgi:hypothetical protein
MLLGVVDHAHLFGQMIRFETELWNAVDRRLRAGHDLPLTWFEPMTPLSEIPQGCSSKFLTLMGEG